MSEKQLRLVELTIEDRIEAGRSLAEAELERRKMEQDHKERRQMMRAEMEAVEAQIKHFAELLSE